MYMLDTNTASYVIKGTPPQVREKLKTISMSDICISAITEAELLRGVAKKPEAKKLPLIVNEFLIRVEIMPWDSKVAKTYGSFSNQIESEGLNLGTMDMLIASHAKSLEFVLVTSDKAFFNLNDYVKLENWT